MRDWLFLYQWANVQKQQGKHDLFNYTLICITIKLTLVNCMHHYFQCRIRILILKLYPCFYCPWFQSVVIYLKCTNDAHIQLKCTWCPSGACPLMTDSASWRVSPVLSPSPTPIISHKTRAVGSFASSPAPLMLYERSWETEEKSLLSTNRLQNIAWASQKMKTKCQRNLPNMLDYLITKISHVLVTFTFLVKLVEDEEPTMALLMTLPEKTDWTELMKLDFPAPTGPTSKTLASVAVSLASLNDPTDSVSVFLSLNTLSQY